MSRNSPQGFSLVELAMALLIIALIMGSALTLGGNAMRAGERVSTQERMKAIQEALEYYAKVNGYLPCPADRALIPGAAMFGMEARAGTVCTPAAPGLVEVDIPITAPATKTREGYIGAVPVRTLGLPDSYAADAWNDKFTYVVSKPHVAGPESYGAALPKLNIYYGDRTGAAGNYALSNAIAEKGGGATYVLISHGPDGKGAFPLRGAARGKPCATGSQNDAENCDDANLDFYDTEYNDGKNQAQYFDDYVLWGTNSHVGAPLVATTGCPTGTCESWCAPCVPNSLIPGANWPMDPVAPTGTANFSSPVLCQKIITSTSPCQATCIWSGMTPHDYARCP